VISTSVCVSVCLTASISLAGTARAILTIFFVHVACGRGYVLLRQGDKIPRGRNSFGGFFPIDNAVYSIAVETHTKMAEPIDMPFGMMTRVGLGAMY